MSADDRVTPKEGPRYVVLIEENAWSKVCDMVTALDGWSDQARRARRFDGPGVGDDDARRHVLRCGADQTPDWLHRSFHPETADNLAAVHGMLADFLAIGQALDDARLTYEEAIEALARGAQPKAPADRPN